MGGIQAIYYEDGKWYNAVLDALNSDQTFLITFLGYGNQEIVTLDQMRVQESILNPKVSEGRLLKAPVKIGELEPSEKAKAKQRKYRGIDIEKEQQKALQLRR